MKKTLLMVAWFVGAGVLSFSYGDVGCQGPDCQDSGRAEGGVVKSTDPNEILGSVGVGESRYVQEGDWLSYTIYFENKTNATAAAQEVFVDLPMDPNLDWTTLELGEIAFGEHLDMGLSGRTHGTTSFALPGTNSFVKTTVTSADGVLHWYLRDWDPNTLDNFPLDPQGGFLPPNNPETHCGEGRLSYRVKVKAGAVYGNIARASATIVFDQNEAITTDPSWWNTIGEFRTVSFEGLADTNLTLIAGEPFGMMPAPAARPGYVFDAWYTGSGASGVRVTEDADVPSGLVRLYPNWIPVPYSITYSETKGLTHKNPAAYTVEDEIVFEGLPDYKGWHFVGWNIPSISVGTMGDVVVTAQWQKARNEIVEDIQPIIPESFVAMTYDGYLYREDGGVVVGTVQVKAAKPKKDKKTGKTATKLTIGVQMAGESKKVSISGDYDLTAGSEQAFVKGGRTISLLLGENGMAGSFEGHLIEGVPNVFGLKDSASKAKAAEAEAAYVGVYNLIADEGSFTVKVAKKGKVTVSGTTAAGKKASASAQLIVGGGIACIPVIAPKAGLAFTVWFGEEDTVDGLTDAVIGKAGTLPEGSVFSLDAAALAELVGDDTYADYFPDGASVEQVKTKWVVMPDAKGKAGKTGKVVLAKDGAVDESKLGENPSALKLTYTAKTGVFKGSFKAYVNNKGKPKAVTVNVAGVMVGDCGYGTATIKNVGSIPISVGL